MSAFLPVEAVASLSPQAQALLGPAAQGAGVSGLSLAPQAASAGASFGNLVSQGLAKVNQGLASSQTDLQRLALGDATNLHQVMINLEESRLSFQLMMQVRSRLLEAYQDLMKMPL